MEENNKKQDIFKGEIGKVKKREMGRMRTGRGSPGMWRKMMMVKKIRRKKGIVKEKKGKVGKEVDIE